MICTKCGEDKEKKDFFLRSDRPRGVASWCKACFKVRRLTRREKLSQIKIARGCVDCGFNTHPAALHFDHREPDSKSFDIAHSVENSWEDVLKETEKCDVRCANCHAIRHAKTADSYNG